MRNIVINEIGEMAQKDSRIVVMTADLGYGVLEKFSGSFPNRFFNVGISEQFMASAAAGIALCGNIVFTYSIGNFATLRCIEQIRNDICYHSANVKIIAVAGGFSYGQLGMSHHATEDIAMMRSLPNMQVFVPADPEEAHACIAEAVQTDGPCYLRLARRGEPVLYQKTDQFDITKIQTVRLGKDAALLVCGPLLQNGLAAADCLEKAGISIGVFSVPCIKPIDWDTLSGVAASYPLLVTLEEHEITGGLGGAVAEVLGEIQGSRARLCRLGLQDIYPSIVGSHQYLCDYYGLSPEKIAERVLQFVR